ARTNFTVLIQGESGSGKSFVAKIIHNYSLGNKGPFVSVDCGAIPETLIESELFGYEKGSFTGAGQQKKGYFESANGGTIFLDDIENLPFHLQSKLLKIVHDKRMQRIGSTKSIPLDVRLIAAANIPLEKLIKSGKFRSDLYFRLNEFGLFIPPLRERKEDIMYLATIFLNMASRELGKKISGFSPEAEAVIKSHYWPGNVRELKNIVRRAALMCEDEILPEYLILDKFDSENKESLPDVKFDGNISETKSLKDIFSELERDIILKTLQKTKWNRKKAAEILKIDYKTIIYKIKNYNL
ncbi:MAG: sigma-54 dependent transcriptional regulator, partial [Thermodesulfobacteriota bacterium]|nr:sigma-54 dependent transcriptional regulator [Thermodesulfobacteriota bacterium]